MKKLRLASVGARFGTWWFRGGALLLILAALAVFGNSLNGDFGGDGHLLAQQPRVHEITAENLNLIFTKSYWFQTVTSLLYRPVTTLSYLLNYVALGNGDNPFGYHLFNLLCHLLCVLAGYWLASVAIGRDIRAWFAAAIFAVHPVNAEAVTNIAGRADLMTALLVLTTLAIHTRLGLYEGARRALALAGIFLAALLAVAAKESGIIALPVLIVYDWVLRPKLPRRRVHAGYLAASLALVCFLSARLYLLPKWHSPASSFLLNPILGAAFLPGRLTAMRVLVAQLGHLIWPEHLSWDYSFNQHPVVASVSGWLAAAFLSGLAGFAVWLRRRSPAVAFLLMLLLLAMAPTSNVFVLIGTIQADRFLYLPSLALGGIAAILVWAGVRRATAFASQKLPILAPALAAGLLLAGVLALGVRGYARSLVWDDNPRLAIEDAAEAPDSCVAIVFAASAQFRDAGLGDADPLIARFQSAAAMLDTLPPVNRTTGADKSIGTLWRRKAEVDGVPREVRDADYAWALEYLGRAETIDIARRTDQANRDLAKGFPRDMLELSGDEQIYQNQVAILLALGRLAEAEDKAHTLLLLAPLTPAWHRLMSQVRVAAHKPEAAILDLFEASEVSERRQFEPGIPVLYRSLDPAGCESGKEGVLNLDCAQVAAARARAHGDLIQLLRESGRADQVPRLERRFGKPAVEQPGAAGSSSKLRNMSFR